MKVWRKFKSLFNGFDVFMITIFRLKFPLEVQYKKWMLSSFWMKSVGFVWVAKHQPMSTICRMGKMLRQFDFQFRKCGIERNPFGFEIANKTKREWVFLFHTVLIEIRTFLLFWRLCDSIKCKFVKRISLGQKVDGEFDTIVFNRIGFKESQSIILDWNSSTC